MGIDGCYLLEDELDFGDEDNREITQEALIKLKEASERRRKALGLRRVWEFTDTGVVLAEREYRGSYLFLIPGLIIILQEAKKLGYRVDHYLNPFSDDYAMGYLKIIERNGKSQISISALDGMHAFESGKIGELYIFDPEKPVENWQEVKPTPILGYLQ